MFSDTDLTKRFTCHVRIDSGVPDDSPPKENNNNNVLIQRTCI